MDDYIFTNEGLILGTENEFSWPIELLLLGKGAALDYNLDVLYIESAQGALMTPKGTVISGIGSYNGDNLTFKAMVTIRPKPRGPDSQNEKIWKGWRSFRNV